MDYVFLLTAAALLSVCFVTNKLYEREAGTSLRAGFSFNVMLGALATVIFFCIGGFTFRITPYSMIMATLLTVLVVTYTLLGFRILKDGSVSVYTLFLMSGGMTVPYVYGILFLGEDFTARRTIGIVLLIGAVALSNFKGKGERVKLGNILMCVAVFFLNGFVSVTSKVHQEGFGAFTDEASGVFPHVDTAHFVMLSGIAKVAVCGSVLLILTLIGYIKAKKSAPVSDNSGIDSGSDEKKSTEPSFSFARSWRRLVPIIVMAAVLDSVSYFLQLKGAENLPATVLYPMVTGASIVFMPIVAFIAFREKPTKFIIISVCLSFVATLLFL